ncbi:MAG: hypothetical protein JW738_06695 [Actinobacteria bacterium]|nr:hypothetical protein [Actinomycetota bacterium]
MIETGKTKKKQANFFLPETLLKELRRLVPPKHRSLVVGEAIEKELARIRSKGAIEKYFGAWKTDSE